MSLELVDRKYVMKLMNWSETTLWRREREGVIPPAIRLGGGHPRWRLRDLEAAIEAGQEVPHA